MAHLLIFEPDHTGHRLRYVQLLAQAAIAKGDTVTLATTCHARNSDPFLEFIEDLEESITIADWIQSPTTGGVRGFWSRLAWLRESIERFEPDQVLIPYADGLAQVLGVAHRLRITRLPNVPIRGLLFRCGAAYPNQGSLASRWKQIVSAKTATWFKWDRLFHLDEVAVDWYQKAGTTIHHMPDPVDPPLTLKREEARRQIGIEAEGKIIGLVGLIDERKGTDHLIEAFCRANPQGAKLLLVGKVKPQITEILRTQRVQDFVETGRIIVFDGWASNELMLNAISAMDVVCTPYPRHMGSASILLRASAVRRPVLGSDFGWIQHMIQKYQLGESIDVADHAVFAKAIQTSLTDTWQNQVSTSGMKQLESFHSEKNFQRIWLHEQMPPS